MSQVILRKATYDYKTLKSTLFPILNSLAKDLIHPGSRVLIKPNLLAPSTPDKAVVTHPLMVKAAVEYVLENGGRPCVSDSPAMGSFDKVIRESGLKSVLQGLPVEIREFKKSSEVEVGEPFKKIEIAENALRADVMINIPKLKTHSQMLLTLGVKNLFGCIVGLKKPEWHLRAGVNRKMFAHLLVKIYSSLKPSLTILDGIIAMEGQGPGRSGTPRELGILGVSTDALAMDMTVTHMLGLKPEALLTNKVAMDMGIAPRNISVDGEIPVIRNFNLPRITDLMFGPKKFHGLMRRHLVQKPVVETTLCKLCGECWNYCPAQAITRGEKKIRFDYEQCIRCYCCLEVCPQGALKTAEPLPGAIIRKFTKK
jgi:uncharacterized protein (DUF362 family)/Pyruvate/2-oxoacid:ferredoxin oxidoreductase delta subunit